MITVIGKARIAELDTFLAVFSTRGRELRGRHGSLGAHVHRDPDRADGVLVVFCWTSREDFEGFLANPEVAAAMRASGTLEPPAFTIVEQIAAYDA